MPPSKYRNFIKSRCNPLPIPIRPGSNTPANLFPKPLNSDWHMCLIPDWSDGVPWGWFGRHIPWASTENDHSVYRLTVDWPVTISFILRTQKERQFPVNTCRSGNWDRRSHSIRVTLRMCCMNYNPYRSSATISVGQYCDNHATMGADSWSKTWSVSLGNVRLYNEWLLKSFPFLVNPKAFVKFVPHDIKIMLWPARATDSVSIQFLT